jgi:hypothetical protein
MYIYNPVEGALHSLRMSTLQFAETVEWPRTR